MSYYGSVLIAQCIWVLLCAAGGRWYIIAPAWVRLNLERRLFSFAKCLMAGRRRPTTSQKKSLTASSLSNLVQESQNIVICARCNKCYRDALWRFPSLVMKNWILQQKMRMCVVPVLSFESENRVPPLCRTNKTLAVLYIICLHSQTEWAKKKISSQLYMFWLSFFWRIIHFTLSLRLFFFRTKYLATFMDPLQHLE